MPEILTDAYLLFTFVFKQALILIQLFLVISIIMITFAEQKKLIIYL